MKPQDIDKIANLVVGSLSGAPGAGLLGCGSISSGQNYDLLECNAPAAPFYTCGEGGYECGGTVLPGRFACCAGFDCLAGHLCPGEAEFLCANDQLFHCMDQFACGFDTFSQTNDPCGLL